MKQHHLTHKFYPIFILLIWFSANATAQKETSLFIGTNGKLTTIDKALFIQKINTKSEKKTSVHTLKLKDSDWEKFNTELYEKENDSTFHIKVNGEDFTGSIYRTFQKQPDGTYLFKDQVKGVLVREGSAQSVVPLLLHGKVTDYYKTGNKKSVSIYTHNELVSNENWNDDGSKYIDNIFYSVDDDPTFTPGMGVLHKHVLQGFKNAGIDLSSISGRIVIGFVVTEKGTIEGAKILQGLGPTINTVALEQIKTLAGEWKPARLNNEKVNYFQVFPINFIYKQYQFEFAELRKAILHFGAY